MFGIDSLIGAGMGMFGGLLNNMFAGSRQRDQQNFNAAMQEDQQLYNSAEAVKNRDFQDQQRMQAQSYNTEMSNTSWQRGVADMRKAGINPMLAFSKGGASAPMSSPGSGSQASSGQASTGQAQVFDVLGPAVSTAMAVQNFKNLEAEESLKRDHGMLTRMQANTEAQRAKLVAEQAGVSEGEKKRLRHLEPLFKKEGLRGANEGEFHGSTIGRILDMAGIGAQRVGDIVSPLTKSRGMFPSRSTSETTHSSGGSSFTERFDGLWR